MNERIKELYDQANIRYSVYETLKPRDERKIIPDIFAELVVGHAIECVRDVLRDENSDLSYTAASQVQKRIKEFFGVEE